MRKNESITHLMTKDLVTGTVAEQFSAIKNKMEENHVHHIPILDGEKLVGIVSRTDVLNYSHSRGFVSAEEQVDASLDQTVAIAELMTKEPVTLKSNDTIKHAVEVLADHSFNSVPVVSSTDNKLVGVVTTNDVMSYLIQQY